MNGRFVTIIGNPAIADYTLHKKHFKYLTPTPEEEANLISEAQKWAVYHTEDTEVSHDEFGDYALDTKYSTTRLTDFYGDIVIKDGKIRGVVNDSRFIRCGEKLVEKSDLWESRAVYYYTRTYTLKKVTENK